MLRLSCLLGVFRRRLTSLFLHTSSSVAIDHYENVSVYDVLMYSRSDWMDFYWNLRVQVIIQSHSFNTDIIVVMIPRMELRCFYTLLKLGHRLCGAMHAGSDGAAVERDWFLCNQCCGTAIVEPPPFEHEWLWDAHRLLELTKTSSLFTGVGGASGNDAASLVISLWNICSKRVYVTGTTHLII